MINMINTIKNKMSKKTQPRIKIKTATARKRTLLNRISTKPKQLHNCKLISLDKITNKQIQQLSYITNDKNIMKHIGKGDLWSIQNIKQFAKDEQIESKKSTIARKYYSFILICNNKVIGFISGRKNTQLLPDNISQYDLLLRMFISSTYIGKGYGKLILQLFIQTYNKIISKSIKDNESGQSGKSGQSGQTGQSSTPIKITLFSDILKTNIPSIKTHLSNGFIFNNTIKYPNAKYYERYILDMDI